MLAKIIPTFDYVFNCDRAGKYCIGNGIVNVAEPSLAVALESLVAIGWSVNKKETICPKCKKA